MFSAAQNIWVVEQDTVPMIADSTGYYRTSLSWYRKVKSGDYDRILRHLFRPGVRPPLPQMFTTGLFLVTDQPSQRMARHSILLFLCLLLVATYGIGVRLRGPPAGLVAAVLLACFPHVIGYSRSYWMDLPASALVALGVWALLTTDGFLRRRRSVLFGLIVGLGMLTKFTFLVFLIGPLLHVVITTWRGDGRTPPRDRRRVVVENICLALLVATLICGVWYAVTIGGIWKNFIFNQGVGVLRARPWLTLDNALLYLRHLGRIQLGYLFTAVLVVSLPMFWLHARTLSRWVLLSWFAVPYFFFTFLVLGIEWARFTMPYLPAVALIMALGLLRFRYHLLTRIGVPAVCLVALWSHVTASFTEQPPLSLGQSLWMKRITSNGLLAPGSYDHHMDILKVFPPPPRRRRVHVAIMPNIDNIASLLNTWSYQQLAHAHFSVPYDPESFSFGRRFIYPERVHRTEYMLMFHYMVQVIPPVKVELHSRRPGRHRHISTELWQQLQHRFDLFKEERMPNGFRLMIYRQRAPFSKRPRGPGRRPRRGTTAPTRK